MLQFIYTQVMMFALLALAETWKGGRLNYTNVHEMLLALNFVLALFIFIGHFYYDVSDGVFKEFFYSIYDLYWWPCANDFHFSFII